MKEKTGNILIVDDNTSILKSLELYLKHQFKTVKTLTSPNQIPFLLSTEDIDIILLDMNFTAGVNTGNEGIFWLRKILKQDPSIVVLMITAYGDIELAVKAIKEGAADFITKPWDNQRLLATIQAALKLRLSNKEIRKLKLKQKQINEDIDRNYGQIIGESQVMNELYKTISKVAQTEANILLMGENGTGKELIAREIHRQSKRSQKDFMSVDLGALSETLFESELFGHTKGAFTDAKDDRIGRFEAATGGTLFLDEIGNLSFSLQAKLLSAIEQKKVIPLGSNREIPVDIRIISATNKDLPSMVTEKLFREDLFYRLNTVQINIPPLRDRDNDIILISEFYLNQLVGKYDRMPLKFTSGALDKLKSHSWPGNIRELRHTIEKAVILCESDILTPQDFSFATESDIRTDLNKCLSLEEGEKFIIKNALSNNNWNISEAAKELGIGRQTLYRKIEKFGLQ
ncbi:MAG: sigma-54-dependent Fis family transcriptional regulator [Bacteroidales bacterium]|nr:MAG: sigma-54-dependent Fis family transcriptional regulator [Bacteroidales bacterium]